MTSPADTNPSPLDSLISSVRQRIPDMDPWKWSLSDKGWPQQLELLVRGELVRLYGVVNLPSQQPSWSTYEPYHKELEATEGEVFSNTIQANLDRLNSGASSALRLLRFNYYQEPPRDKLAFVVSLYLVGYIVRRLLEEEAQAGLSSTNA